MRGLAFREVEKERKEQKRVKGGGSFGQEKERCFGSLGLGTLRVFFRGLYFFVLAGQREHARRVKEGQKIKRREALGGWHFLEKIKKQKRVLVFFGKR